MSTDPLLLHLDGGGVAGDRCACVDRRCSQRTRGSREESVTGVAPCGTPRRAGNRLC